MPLSAVTIRRVRLGLGTVLLGALLVVPFAAFAEGEDPAVIDKITNLNKKALDAYNNLEFEDARKMLKQALDLCSSAGLDKHPIKARTHIHMGVVLSTTKQQELGMKQFRKALEIQPDIQVTKALANPEILQSFAEAQASLGTDRGSGGGEPGGGDARSSRGTGGDAGGDLEGEGVEVVGDISLIPVTRGRRGKPVPISVTVSPDLKGYTKVVLGYKAQGAPDFVGADLRRSGNRFIGEIPAEATQGSTVQYFVQAENDEEDPVATNGSEEKPYAVALSTGGGAGGGGGGARDAEDTEGGDEDFRKYFFSLSGGSGFGYTSGQGELNVANQVSASLAPSTAFHIAPEVGYFLRPQFRLSVQLRLQVVTGRTPLNLDVAVANGGARRESLESCGSDHICSTGSPLAPAVFARGSWFFGTSSLRPYFSLAVGAGIIRHVVKFSAPTTGPYCGVKGDLPCVDSVLAGPIFAGPGGGIHFALTPVFGLIAEVNSVIGFPKFTFHLDGHAGVAARF